MRASQTGIELSASDLSQFLSCRHPRALLRPPSGFLEQRRGTASECAESDRGRVRACFVRSRSRGCCRPAPRAGTIRAAVVPPPGLLAGRSICIYSCSVRKKARPARLTAKQLVFLERLVRYQTREGVPPTVREMQELGGF